VADYAAAAASPPPLLLQTAWNGEETCSIIRIGARGGGLAEIPISKASGSESLLVADLGYDPILRSRAVALETTAGSVQIEVSLETGAPTSFHRMRDGTKLRIIVSQEPKLIGKIKETTECGERTFEPARGGAPVMITLLASAVSGGGSSPVFSPRIQTPAGTVFRALGNEAESTDGAQRGYVWSGYVSRDGKSVAFQFKVRAVWTDPEDGRQYYVAQAASPMEGSTSSRFFALKKDEFVLASAISPGVATPRTLELRVSGGE
jgi:hypothetical protein